MCFTIHTFLYLPVKWIQYYHVALFYIVQIVQYWPPHLVMPLRFCLGYFLITGTLDLTFLCLLKVVKLAGWTLKQDKDIGLPLNANVMGTVTWPCYAAMRSNQLRSNWLQAYAWFQDDRLAGSLMAVRTRHLLVWLRVWHHDSSWSSQGPG